MKAIKSNKKGFTIIEALIVIFIIAMISTIIIVGLRSGEKQYQVKLAAQEIAQNIRRAQDMALTSFKHNPSIRPPYNYGLYFSTSQRTSYIIFADENSNTNRRDGSDTDIEIINIASGVEINSLSTGSNLNITFSLPDGFVVIDDNPSRGSATVIIRKSNTSCSQEPRSCKRIEVIKTGQINVKNY